VSAKVLDLISVTLKETILFHFVVLFMCELSETPSVGQDNLLATGKLELGTTEGLNGIVTITHLASY
jgi:hypothetical protein